MSAPKAFSFAAVNRARMVRQRSIFLSVEEMERDRDAEDGDAIDAGGLDHEVSVEDGGAGPGGRQARFAWAAR